VRFLDSQKATAPNNSIIMTHKPPIWQRIKNSIKTIIDPLGRLLWFALLHSRQFRRLVFDAAPKSSLLLATGSETYLVSSQDKIIGRSAYLTGEFDFEKLEKALKILGGNFEASVLIDIGANIGTISIPAIKRKVFGSAVAVEPEPFNYGLLVANIHINGLASKIKSYNVALGARDDEEVEFELSNSNYGDHRIKISDKDGAFNESSRKNIKVNSETFDKIIGNVDPLKTLIWMDTQGFEGYVLAGAAMTLKKHTPIVIEFWPYGMTRSGSYPILKKSILGAGYEAFYDLDAASAPIDISEASLDELYHRLGEGGKYTDLLIR
jgi:FkbM family methyltransferase